MPRQISFTLVRIASNTGQGLTVADFNGDGLQDIGDTGNNASPSIILGTQLGINSSTLLLPLSGGNWQFDAKSGDLNGDGIPDLVISNANDNNIIVTYGSRNNTFSTQQLNTDANPHLIAVENLNADIFSDVIVANYDSNDINVFLSQGNSNFIKIVLQTGIQPVSVAASDLNGDGLKDIIVANMGNTIPGGNSISIFNNQGNNSFVNTATLSVGIRPVEVISEDLNLDGLNDIITVNAGPRDASRPGSISVLLNQGNGIYLTSEYACDFTGSYWIKAIDLNGDGKKDLVVSNGGVNYFDTFINDGTGQFTTGNQISLGFYNSFSEIISTDWNHDGLIDLIAADYTTGSLLILQQNQIVISQTTPVKFNTNSHYYSFVSGWTNWENADYSSNQITYRGLQGYLATVTSSAEDSFIYFNLITPLNLPRSNGNNIGLGATDSKVEGVWRWTGGPEKNQILSYTNWSLNQPDSGVNQNYLSYTWWNNQWDDMYLDNSISPPNGYAGFIVEFGGVSPTIRITNSASTVNEGETITFIIDTVNIEWDSILNYSISGITQSDLSSGNLNGTLTVNQNNVDGRATLTIGIAADHLTEGTETLTISVSGVNSSVSINDTSIGNNTTSYSVNALQVQVKEGSYANFLINARNVPTGTVVNYNLSGSISSLDVVGGLTGSTIINSSGQATVSIPIVEDLLAEGNENLIFSCMGETANVIIQDTSRPQPSYDVQTLTSKITPGNDAIFIISTKNFLPGESIFYSIEGVSQNEILGLSLNGSLNVGNDSNAILRIPTAVNGSLLGNESIKVTVGNKSSSAILVGNSDVSISYDKPVYLKLENYFDSDNNLNNGFTPKLVLNVFVNSLYDKKLSSIKSFDFELFVEPLTAKIASLTSSFDWSFVNKDLIDKGQLSIQAASLSGAMDFSKPIASLAILPNQQLKDVQVNIGNVKIDDQSINQQSISFPFEYVAIKPANLFSVSGQILSSVATNKLNLPLSNVKILYQVEPENFLSNYLYFKLSDQSILTPTSSVENEFSIDVYLKAGVSNFSTQIVLPTDSLQTSFTTNKNGGNYDVIFSGDMLNISGTLPLLKSDINIGKLTFSLNQSTNHTFELFASNLAINKIAINSNPSITFGVSNTDIDGSYRMSLLPAGDITFQSFRTENQNDSNLTIEDAVRTLQIASGLKLPNYDWKPSDYIAADFNGDGYVTSADALDILNYYVRIIKPLNVLRTTYIDSNTLSNLKISSFNTKVSPAMTFSTNHTGSFYYGPNDGPKIDLIGILSGDVI